jgi:hypothetical protein
MGINLVKAIIISGFTFMLALSQSYTANQALDKLPVGYNKYCLLLLGIDQSDAPDLLAGPIWQKSRSYSGRGHSYRPLVLGEDDDELWEWIGPKSGIILLGEDPPTEFTLEGSISNRTSGTEWETVYDALASFDQDGNGVLKGEELKTFWLWNDKNSDSFVDDSEITKFSDFAVSVSCKSQKLDGNFYQIGGIVDQEGNSINTWQWWMLPVNPTLEITEFEGREKSMRSMIVGIKTAAPESVMFYSWSISDTDFRGNSGFLRFIETKHGLYVISLGTDVYWDMDFTNIRSQIPLASYRAKFARVVKEGNTLKWTFQAPDFYDSSTVEVKEGGNYLMGLSKYRVGADTSKAPQTYRWVAKAQVFDDMPLWRAYALYSLDPKEFEVSLDQTEDKEGGEVLLPDFQAYVRGDSPFPKILPISQ